MLGQMIAQMMLSRGQGGMSGMPQTPPQQLGAGTPGSMLGAMFGIPGNTQSPGGMSNPGNPETGLQWGAQNGGGLAQLLALLMKNKQNGGQTMANFPQMQPQQPQIPGQSSVFQRFPSTGGVVDPQALRPSLWRHMSGAGSGAGSLIGRMF